MSHTAQVQFNLRCILCQLRRRNFAKARFHLNGLLRGLRLQSDAR